MKRVLTYITFMQQPSAKWPARDTTLIFYFVHEFEINSTWRDLTDKGKITLPKNVFIKDGTGKLVALLNTNTNIGGFSTNAPIFLRGDKVNIQWGYAYYQNGGQEVSPMVDVFTGYISLVQSKNTFTLEVMDNMYILQQKQAQVKEWSNMTVGAVIQQLITYAGLNFTVSDKGPLNSGNGTSLGTFRTGNETIAQVLSRLRKDYGFEATFVGDTLFCGAHFYDANKLKSTIPTFTFQQNIISDNLKYMRTDDLTLSMLATSTAEEESGGMTKDGQRKTKKIRLQVLVTFPPGLTTYTPGPGGPIVDVIPAGQPVPDNVEGERKTGIFLQATTVKELTDLAIAELQKLYYTGFKGKFTTFGMPFINQGDAISIVDNILPERNGTYWVRGVKYSGGVGGLRQEIELDYKISL